MAETKDVLLKIQVSYKEAIDNIVKLGDQLEELRRKQKDLQKQTVIEGSEEQKARDAELEAVNAEIRLLSKAQREYRSEIDANLQAEEAQTGSLKEMRAQLKNLLREYDSLSQVDREEIGGVGEQKLLEIRRLQEELRQAEEASGRFQRSVGSYEDAIRKALDGTIPMRQAMRDLKVEIQTVQFQYVQMGSTIQQRTKDLDDLGKAVGTDTEEYKEQAAELEKLKAEYDATGQSLDQMKQAAGQMDDAMKDASQSIANFGADNANLKAMTQGAQLLLNGYTALQAGMTALGIESEELYNIFSKIEILQKGLNAVNQIANMLEKQSILSQQARVLWTKLTTTSIATLTAAKKKDAVASAEAAAGDTALAAGEVAATGAAGALTVALKAVSTAIKNIPVIGWILAAVAALGTLIGFIVKANKESKKGNDLIEQRKQLAAEINEIEKNVAEQTRKATVEMESNVRHLKEAKEGTEEWDTLIQQVADDLGVDAEWLKKNKDKVDKLKDAWIQLQIAMAKGQAYAQKMAENEIKLVTFRSDVERILAENPYKDRVEALQKELKISKQMAENIVKADHQLKKNDTADNFVKYANAINDAQEVIVKNNELMKQGIDEAYEEQKAATDEMSEIAGDAIKTTKNKAVKASKDASKDIKANFKKLTEQIEDMMVESMAEGLEKDIAEVKKESDRWIENMKEAREKDLENKDEYDKLILLKEKATNDKILKMRDTGYRNIIQSAQQITDAYNKLWASYAPNSFYNFVQDMGEITREVTKNVNDINQQIYDLQDAIEQYRNTSEEQERIAVDNEEIAKGLREQITDKLPEITVPVKPEIIVDNEAIRQATAQLATTLLNAGWQSGNARGMAEDMMMAFQEIMEEALGGSTKTLEQLVKDKLNGLKERMSILIPNRDAISVFIGELQKVFDVFLDQNKAVKDDLSKYQKDLAAYNKRRSENAKIEKENTQLTEQATDAEKKATEAREKQKEATENLTKAEEKLKEQQKSFSTDFAKQILINRQMTKGLQEYAETIQGVLLEQAKLGSINLIPDDFSVYIDYQIDALEEKLARSYNDLDRLARNGSNDTDFEAEKANYNELMKQLSLYREAKKRTFDNKVVTDNEGLMNNAELIENAKNLQMVRNQIAVVQQAIETGRMEQVEVDRLTEQNNELYMKRLELIQQMSEETDEAAKGEIKAQMDKVEGSIAANNALIEQHRETMAMMGYTTEEQMQQTLDGLKQQEQAFSKDTTKIMRSIVASTFQSISTVTNSLVDLFNEIGEDNAQMAGFLEAMAYMQIGVNMAVGLSEAIAAGAGLVWPANLAAIASGVAAVVAGIAEAISIYKQYHKNISSPKFATGGLIGGRTARTKSEGRRDDVPIMASVGEYVINHQAVKEYGVGFFDEINYGRRKKRTAGGLNFADGGYVDIKAATKAISNEEQMEMLSEVIMNMPAPVVSVKEISGMQRRVTVKENIAKNN